MSIDEKSTNEGAIHDLVREQCESTKTTGRTSVREPIVCTFCNKSFKFYSTLRQHEKIHYGIKQHECDICKRRFLHKGTLKCHLRLHTGETPYKCPHCPKAFHGQTALNCHVFRHTKVGVKCPKCPMVFATRSIVNQHLKQVHTDERSHVCNVCGVTYKHLKSLRMHLRNHHKRVCPDCGTIFDSVYGMQKHRKLHIEKRLPFRCGYCNRSFAKESELDRHERLRGRTFQCDVCCHSFNKQIFLVNHNRRVHWKAMGLERLKVAEPKNGWNRKGVPKPKKAKKPDETDDSISSIEPAKKEGRANVIQHPSALEIWQEEFTMPNENHGNDEATKRMVIVDDSIINFASDEYIEHCRLEEEKQVTELILVHDSGAVDDLQSNVPDELPLASMCGDNPLESENENAQSKRTKRKRNMKNIETRARSATGGSGDEALKYHTCEAQPRQASSTALMCELCGNRFASATTLIVHRMNQHHSRRFECEQCDRAFGFRCYLEKHIATHHQNKRIACELCDKSFKYVQDLKVHLRHHDDSKPFKCDQCPSAFRFPSALRSHRILHLEESPFGCDVCGKKFRFSNSLRVHKRLHGGIKQFKCGVCEREFSTKAPMLRHMKVHSNGKQLSCVVCAAVFHKKVDLAIHESKEHPKHNLISKPTTIYPCVHCGKEFIKNSNLKAHSYIHEEVYRFQCQLCSQSFKQHAGLRGHLNKVHKEVQESPEKEPFPPQKST